VWLYRFDYVSTTIERRTADGVCADRDMFYRCAADWSVVEGM
jgi:hypothetical protein